MAVRTRAAEDMAEQIHHLAEGQIVNDAFHVYVSCGAGARCAVPARHPGDQSGMQGRHRRPHAPG